MCYVLKPHELLMSSAEIQKEKRKYTEKVKQEIVSMLFLVLEPTAHWIDIFLRAKRKCVTSAFLIDREERREENISRSAGRAEKVLWAWQNSL